MQVISTTQYYSIFFFQLFLCIVHLFSYFRNVCIPAQNSEHQLGFAASELITDAAHDLK